MNTEQVQARPAVMRRAKLFEVGEYPDKGITVTHDHLRALVDSFQPVPIFIEHAQTPLEMGQLVTVECLGDELFGTVSLSAEADALVQRSGAKSLSLGLASDLSAIQELSLVRNPRIASARLFGMNEVAFVGEIIGMTLDGEWRRLREAQVDQQIDDLLREGRLCPSQIPFAKGLLLSDDTVHFDGDSTAVRQLAFDLILRQPRVSLSTEVAHVPQGDFSQHLMMPEEAEFYRRHFPDVSLDEIAKRR